MLGCIGTVKGKIVALIRHPAALEEDCRLADIVIAPFSIGKRCSAARVIVDRHVLKEQGAHALYIEGLLIRTETVVELRGRRPWVPDIRRRGWIGLQCGAGPLRQVAMIAALMRPTAASIFSSQRRACAVRADRDENARAGGGS